MDSPSPRQRAKELLHQIPDDAACDEVPPHQHAAELIRKRIAESDDPQTKLISHEDARVRLSRWLTQR